MEVSAWFSGLVFFLRLHLHGFAPKLGLSVGIINTVPFPVKELEDILIANLGHRDSPCTV